jgi:hypothetical protein
MNDAPAPRYSIEDLAALTELPRRTVRFYIQQGLVARPIGEKRAAYYTASHLEQLLTIRKWQGANTRNPRRPTGQNSATGASAWCRYCRGLEPFGGSGRGRANT